MSKNLKFKNIYSFLPRFVAADEIGRADGTYLPLIKRRFEWNHAEFGLIISPALITGGTGGGQHHFPSERERLVESALLELADPANPNFYEEEGALVVRLKVLLEVAAETAGGVSLTTGDIELALRILSHSAYELTSAASVFTFYPIKELSRAERDGEVYYRALLTSLNPGADATFDYLFGDDESLTGPGKTPRPPS